MEPAVASPPLDTQIRRYALLGNPNTGKTTLFNRLCGMRARTGNYPGVTVDARFGRTTHRGSSLDLIDLPGVYGLFLPQPESQLCRKLLAGEIPTKAAAEGVLVVVDANNLPRNLVLVGEVLTHAFPTIVALNMSDLAERQGLRIDHARLSESLGCPVVKVSARTGAGIDELLDVMTRAPGPRTPSQVPAEDPASASEARPRALAAWASDISRGCTRSDGKDAGTLKTRTDRLDAVFLHPLTGPLSFALVMTALFAVIFDVATIPMDLIEAIFSTVGAQLEALLPAGALRSLLVEGIVGGVAGTVVFVPQIFLLFFLICFIEDTGYLARAALVADRIMRRFGLPGHAFVPLLSSHACAIPGILCTRMIPDRRDRLVTILVAPFMSCSARLPVYVLLVGLLFGDRPLLAALTFTACYVLGAVAALGSAALARRTVLPGDSRPMVLELPNYKWPSLRTALLTAFDRSLTFLKKAGTVILAICVVMWWLSTYPLSEPPPEANALRVQSRQADDSRAAAMLTREADRIEAHHSLSGSFAGRLGHAVEPVFAPLGYDWQLSIAVLTSFAAREVFVSTLAVIVGATDDLEDPRLRGRIHAAQRTDGTPLLDTASAVSLLVFYVLALQCLPTLAVTRRETGGWRWAFLQLGYMTAVAYLAALGVFTAMRVCGLS